MCEKCKNIDIERKKGISLDTLAQLGKNEKKEKIKQHRNKAIQSKLSIGLAIANEAKREAKLYKIEQPKKEKTFKEQKENSSGRKRKRVRKQKYVFVARAEQQEGKRKVLQIEEENENKKILRAYWNMFHCQSSISVTDGKPIKGRLCKNRLCLICNKIKTAELINKYEPVLEAWKDSLYMVTLTIKNITGEKLPLAIETMLKTFTKIKDTLKKRYNWGKNPKSKYFDQWENFPKFKGLRKLECTCIKKDSFHPHFHVLVDSKKIANSLTELWVQKISKTELTANLIGTNKDGTKVYLQDISKVNSNEIKNTAKEIFKYFTKIFSSSKNDRAIYIDRLDTIFCALRGRRIFQPFGFKISEYAKNKEVTKTIIDADIDSDLFDFEVTNKHGLLVNSILDKYYTGQLEENEAAKRLFNIQKEHIELFSKFCPIPIGIKYLIDSPPETIKEVQEITEKIKNIDIDFSLDLSIYTPPETPPENTEIYKYNYKDHCYYHETTGEIYFNFKLSPTLLDRLNDFKVTNGTAATMAKIYERKNNIF